MTAAILLCALVSVTDGDTFRAYCPREMTVRIANIDAPERDACPAEAFEATAMLGELLTQPFHVRPLYYDRYGRVVADVLVDGTDVGQTMVSAGVAAPWPFDELGRPMKAKPKGC